MKLNCICISLGNSERLRDRDLLSGKCFEKNEKSCCQRRDLTKRRFCQDSQGQREIDCWEHGLTEVKCVLELSK